MRAGDEDRALHLGKGFEVQHRADAPAHPLQPDLVEVASGQQSIPQGVAIGRGHHQARDHAAHAVADQDHVARGDRRRCGVEVPQSVVQRLAHRVVVERDRHVGRVVELPDLEAGADPLVAHEFVGHVDPGLGTAGQAVDHQDDAAVRVVGLHQVEMRTIDALLPAEQAAQRLPVEARTCQPQAVAGGEIGRQRHLLSLQFDPGVPVRVVRGEFDLMRRQHLGEVFAREAQQCGDRRRRHFAPGRAGPPPRSCGPVGIRGVFGVFGVFGIFGITRHCRHRIVGPHRHQFGAEAVAPERAAQARERQRRGRQQFLRHGCLLSTGWPVRIRQVDPQRPRAIPEHRVHLRRPVAVAGEQQ